MENSPVQTHEFHVTASLSAQERLWIRNELERILESEPFRKSMRYPALLRYVVTKALAGEGHMLKERTLGVEVFNRALEYDTNADPVVRFTASEVRRRLAQYYQQDGEPRLIEIHLPLGSYVPEFVRRGIDVHKGAPAELGASILLPLPVPLDPVGAKSPDWSANGTGLASRDIESRSARWFNQRILIGTVALAMVVLTVLAFAYRSPTPLMGLWDPLLREHDEVLISVGRPEIDSERQLDDPKMSIKQHFASPGFRVSMTAVSAIAGISGFLHTQKKPYIIHDASSNSLQDLRGRPVVLINANDNQWTTLLLQRLRYHILQEGDFSYIEDSEHPDRKDWGEDFTTPFREQKYDYAIVARYFDQTTGGPVLVVAGIGSNGTEAAGDFVVSSDSLAKFARSAPVGWQSKNFELVLKVEVVNGSTGGAEIIASKFW